MDQMKLTDMQKLEVEKLTAAGWTREAAELMVVESAQDVDLSAATATRQSADE
jgi:hypothetical protein